MRGSPEADLFVKYIARAAEEIAEKWPHGKGQVPGWVRGSGNGDQDCDADGSRVPEAKPFGKLRIG